MERIMYRKTLDVHKNGIQFLLQGFETADNLSRVIEISLMASGDAIDFPLEKIEALMYVTTPKATEPSANKCTIKDNKIVYEVLPIVEEGITNMQLKLIETSVDGATGILASPKFAVEVTKSIADDESAEQTTTFTALEDAMAKAKSVYDERFLRMELSSDCIFRAYYADGTVYETDVLQKLFLNGNVLLSESFAHGGTGIRAGEDTDNSKYYSNVSKSEMLKAKDIMENSEEILEEVKLHGVYTAFSVDFETGEIEYISPSFKFKVNLESGELDAIGQTYKFEDELGRVVEKWLLANKIVLSDLQDISSTHAEEIGELKEEIADLHSEDEVLGNRMNEVESRITPIELGGTEATTKEQALKNLGLESSAEQINKVVEDSQWETLSATAVNVSCTRSSKGADSAIQKGVGLDCDMDLLTEYADFRYIIKKGSKDQGDIKYADSYGCHSYLRIVLGVRNQGSNYVSSDYVLLIGSEEYSTSDVVYEQQVQEDIIIPIGTPERRIVMALKEDGIEISSVGGLSTLYFYFALTGRSGTSGSFEGTIELQGRRL